MVGFSHSLLALVFFCEEEDEDEEEWRRDIFASMYCFCVSDLAYYS